MIRADVCYLFKKRNHEKHENGKQNLCEKEMSWQGEIEPEVAWVPITPGGKVSALAFYDCVSCRVQEGRVSLREW